jgi:hypothetical protein
MPKVGSADPPPMELMVYGFRSASLRKVRLRRWLGEIYRNVYDRPEDSSAVELMLAGLPEPILLR